MSIDYVQGDLFQAGLGGIGHGCNCAGAMGRGIAVEFKRRWPEMYREYNRRCKAGEFTLGDVMVWDTAEITIFNLGTQRSWRSGADLAAIGRAVGGMLLVAEERDIDRIGIPRIGAGLGGLSWSEVQAVLEPAASGSRVALSVFDLDRPPAIE